MIYKESDSQQVYQLNAVHVVLKHHTIELQRCFLLQENKHTILQKEEFERKKQMKGIK